MSKSDSTDIPETLKFKGAEAIIAMAEKIKKEFVIGEGGVVTVDKGFFETILPENMTLAEVKRVQDFQAEVVAATGLALGEVGNDHFRKHKTADALSIEFVAGRDKIGLTYQRSRPFPDGKGGQMTRNGVLSARHQVAGAANKGMFGKVRTHLAAIYDAQASK